MMGSRIGIRAPGLHHAGWLRGGSSHRRSATMPGGLLSCKRGPDGVVLGATSRMSPTSSSSPKDRSTRRRQRRHRPRSTWLFYVNLCPGSRWRNWLQPFLGFVDQQEASGKFYCDHLYLSLFLPNLFLSNLFLSKSESDAPACFVIKS